MAIRDGFRGAEAEFGESGEGSDGFFPGKAEVFGFVR